MWVAGGSRTVSWRKLNARLQDESVNKATVDMNSVIARADMSFELVNVTRINDNGCNSGLTNQQGIDALKTRHYIGGPETLNLVVVPTNLGSGVKGVCIVPQVGMDLQYIKGHDGCAVAVDTLPGQRGGQGRPSIWGRLLRRQGPIKPDDGARLTGMQNTITHEMGHWSSLSHSQGGNGQQDGDIMEASSQYVVGASRVPCRD